MFKLRKRFAIMLIINIQKKEGEIVTQVDIDYARDLFTKKVMEIMKEHIIKIIMYGSCARGDYNQDSDIDIALLTDMDRLEVKRYDSQLMDVVTDIAMNSDAIVQYVCLPIDEYNSKKEWYGYFKNIEKEGKVLYG